MAAGDPRRTVTRLGTAGAGLIVAILAGTAAASYAISGVDPFYFSGVGLRASPAVSNPSPETDVNPQTASTFPSVPGDQYYYYRPPAVTASYDAAPIKLEPAFDITDTVRPSDRYVTDNDVNDPQAVDDRVTQPTSKPSTPNDEQMADPNVSAEQDSLAPQGIDN